MSRACRGRSPDGSWEISRHDDRHHKRETTAPRELVQEGESEGKRFQGGDRVFY